ncbi:MAG: glycogen debranching enzyme N-terminal domain-containing protein [Marinilabiliales bacterium]
MAYLSFDKSELINLEYSLSRELIRSNRAGSYASTTILGCNTRKYHGLLVCPVDELDGENHVILSSLDETVIQRGAEFNLGIHKYPGIYHPRGHKYVREYVIDPIPNMVYRVGGVLLKKEMLLTQEDDRILIRYTLLDAHSPTFLRFKPFLAFRNVHKLTRANMFANTKYSNVQKGIKIKLYNGYKPLYMQFSKQPEYVHVPNWYYNIEYIEEQKRGYDYQEDLMVPGYFELPIKKGEQIIFSGGLSEISPLALKRRFEKEISLRVPRNSYYNCLVNSAQQFIVRRNKKTEIIAGFPWFGRWGRDTFISLPGLTLAIDDVKTCKDVLDTMSSELKGSLFPNMGKGNSVALNSVDAPLWYFWAIQQYYEKIKDHELIWKNYGKKMKKILEGYKNGTSYNIRMHENGLIFAGEPGKALTWMDAIVNGKPVTPRIGYNVEINALWYNAVCFMLELATLVKDAKFINEWNKLPFTIRNSYINIFWSDEKRYLADTVTNEIQDWSVRPNQVFATSLKYSPLSEDQKHLVLYKIEKELLTPKGLRTLSPKNPAYKPKYGGNQEQRDMAYHQGTVWPWLLGHFAEGYLKIHEKSGVAFIEKLYNGFEEDMKVHGIGSISEVYDGDPPHNPGGAISQAWSVAEILRMKTLIDKYKRKRKK